MLTFMYAQVVLEVPFHLGTHSHREKANAKALLQTSLLLIFPINALFTFDQN